MFLVVMQAASNVAQEMSVGQAITLTKNSTKWSPSFITSSLTLASLCFYFVVIYSQSEEWFLSKIHMGY